MRENEKVVFVAGAGHSGSTLLGLALGAHPAIFYAGEGRKSLFLGDPEKPLKKRICKVCGAECPVWRDLALAPGEDLYAALSARTGRPVVVDSTKAVEWIEERSAEVRARGGATLLLFLSRDGRAVTASGLRKHPELDVRAHAERWLAQMEAAEALAARFSGEVARVRYEALVARPEATLAELAARIGVPFDRAMLEPFSSEQHPLGGNAGTQSLLERAQTKAGGLLGITGAKERYYASHPRSFVPDLRWKAELSEAMLDTFEALAGEANRRYLGEDEAPSRATPGGPSAPRTARPKVFGIGLSRTGTRSLTAALGILGFSVDHYPVDRATLETLERGDARFPQLDRFDGISDITVAPYYEDLDRLHPGAKFILTVREEQSWLGSCEHHWASRPAHQEAPRPGKAVAPEAHETHMAIRRFLRAAVYASYGFDRDRFSRAYRRHLASVTAYFRERPGDLLLLDIASGEGFEKLAPFLGVPVPEAPFPHRGARLDPERARVKREQDDARGDLTSRLDEDA